VPFCGKHQLEEGLKMPTYISLIKYTQQGASSIKDSPARLDVARTAAQALGGQIKEWFLTLGQYDAIAIIEMPSEETLAQLLLVLGVAGNIQTETTRAFTEAEYRILLASLP
jgi:uncharacterized protein with GYD domain